MRSGFEVPLADSYVADWVALCGFQERFRRQYVPEFQMERRDGVLISPEFACVFEVKVSRSDFLSTFSTFGRAAGRCAPRASPVGSLHWIVASRGVVRAEDDLGYWGLLVVSGGGLHEVRRANFTPRAAGGLYKIGYHLLWYGKDYPG